MENLSRNIILNDINDENVQSVIQQILDVNEMDRLMVESAVGYEPEPIFIHIMSGGGSVYAGFALVDAIETSFTPIATVGMGYVMSMALMILLAGHARLATKNTTFMMHDVSGGSMGKLTDMMQDAEEMKRLRDLGDKYILEKTNIKKADLAAIYKEKKDYYFDAQEAKKMGIIERIIGEDTEAQVM